MHLPDESVLNRLDRAAQARRSAALIAHLRDDFFLFRQFSQIARLIDGLRQWLLAIDGLVHLHCRRRHNRVQMIRRRNRDAINLAAHLIQHLAEVFVKLRARIFLHLRRVTCGSGIHVAQRDNVFTGTGICVAPAFATHCADAGDVQFTV